MEYRTFIIRRNIMWMCFFHARNWVVGVAQGKRLRGSWQGLSWTEWEGRTGHM